MAKKTKPKIKLSRSITERGIKQYFKNQVGFDIETKYLDIYNKKRTGIIQLGFQSPKGNLQEINLMQDPKFSSNKLQEFHQEKGRIGPYYRGEIPGVESLDLTKRRGFRTIRDEYGTKISRSVLSEKEAKRISTKLLDQSKNIIGHNIINFEGKHLKKWMGKENPISMPNEYWDLIKSNSVSRRSDILAFKSEGINASVVRANDRIRQMRVYEWMVSKAQSSGTIVDTLELTKSLNAMAQEKGLLSKTAELTIGSNMEFLGKQLLGKAELHRAAQDVALQNAVAPKLVSYIEDLKAGRRIKDQGFQNLLKIWKDPQALTSLKVQSQRRALTNAISDLHNGKSHLMRSGSLQAKSYQDVQDIILQKGSRKSSITQGNRLYGYASSPEEILKMAEDGLGSSAKLKLKKIKGLEKISGSKGLSKYVIGAGALAIGSYLLYNTLNSKEEKYKAFSDETKRLKNAASGFSSDEASRIGEMKVKLLTAKGRGEIEALKESKKGKLSEDSSFSVSDMLRIKDRKALEAINQKRKGLREIKLSQYKMMVEDADTVLLRNKKTSKDIYIRLAGIDAPEIRHDGESTLLRTNQDQPYGEKAKERLQELIDSSSKMRLVINPKDRTYGRYVGALFNGNENINLKLVKEGYASSLEFGSAKKSTVERKAFASEGKKAEESGTRMWGNQFFKDWRAYSAGAGRDVTFNSFTSTLRLAKNKYLAEAARIMWEDGTSTEEAYKLGVMSKAVGGFSGKDDSYNSIGGLNHKWFGIQRRKNTDFGSGYRGPATKKEYLDGEYKDQTPFNGSLFAGMAASGAATYSLWDKEFNLFGKTFDVNNLSYMGEFLDKNGKVLSNEKLLNRGKATLGDLVFNATKRAELSLGGIPKAFSVSSVMSPSIFKDRTHTISLAKETLEEWRPERVHNPNIGVGLKDYLTRLTGKELDQYKEVTYREGKLYGSLFKGGEDVILQHAELLQRIPDPKITSSASQLAKSYENMLGNKGIGREHQFLFTGGRTKAEALARKAEAYGHETFSKYARLMDSPVKVLEDFFPHLNPRLKGVMKGIEKVIPSMGVGGEEKLVGSLPKLFSRHALKVLPVVIGLPFLYKTADWMIRQISPEDTVAGKAGLTGILAETVKTADLTYSHFSEATGLTSLRKSVEEKAPGMTGVGPFLGLAMSGMITGTAIGMAVNVKNEARAASGAARYAEMIASKTEGLDMGILKKIPGLGEDASRAIKYGKYGAAAMGLLALPFLLTGLGSSESSAELEKEYSGEKEVAIRKARWWEFGMTPWKGEKIKYYRPNWYRKLLDRPMEKGIYGDEDISPMGKAVKGLIDPYWLEKKHYEDRPYPIAGPSGEGMGIFGPIYESTLGRVLKPPALMHSEELGGGRDQGQRKLQPSVELGGLKGEEGMSPYSAKAIAKKEYSAGYEAAGLRGFVFSNIKKLFTGDSDLYQTEPLLQSSSDIDSVRRKFWDMNLGGLGGLTEAYRRVNPRRKYTEDYINPLKNKMPDWMPGKNYFTDFKTGDPYTKVEEGEYRLPGEGYASRYEELKGIDPSQYPLIHRYKILADVAPYSKEFRKARKQLEGHDPTEYERQIFERTEEQLKERRKKKEFRSEAYDKSAIGRYAGALSDLARGNPLEQLSPISPAHKFLPNTTPVSAYEESIYGKNFKLWENPISDFVSPFLHLSAKRIGLDVLPSEVSDARKVEDYFDKIKYVKYKRLEDQATRDNDKRKARAYKGKKERTIIGMDVYNNKRSLISALPKREKDYYNAFVNAKDEDKKKILELIPKNLQELYTAKWDEDLLAKTVENRVDASEEDKKGIKEDIYNRMRRIQVHRKAERRKLEGSDNLPSDDWIGWRADVDLQDVKMKYIIDSGRDYHYYELWDDRLRSLRRKPYLGEAEEGVNPMLDLNSEISYSDSLIQARSLGIENPEISMDYGGEINYDLEYNKDKELNDRIRELGMAI